jgi:3-oxoacyl-[acyl-carrier-protein] synthase-1
VTRRGADNPVVIGVGAQTSVGLTLPAVSAAVRGGIDAFAGCEYLRLRETGEAITLALLSTLPPDAFGYERMQALAAAAAMEALGPWAERLARHPAGAVGLPVLFSVPPQRPGLAEGAGKRLAQDVMNGLPVRIDRGRCALVDTGHEGGLALLGLAADMLRAGRGDACLVGGVDSYKEIETLHWLEAFGRLKTADQPSGFIPGEGAGFLLLVTRRFAQQIGARPLAELAGWAREVEPNPWYMGRPTRGEGLTAALRGALERDGSDLRADLTYADLNGEAWRVDEWMYAYLRTGRHHAEPLDLRHPADSWGDVGAASGVLLPALAAHELAQARNAWRAALVWAASDTRPFRAACVLRRYEEELR